MISPLISISRFLNRSHNAIFFVACMLIMWPMSGQIWQSSIYRPESPFEKIEILEYVNPDATLKTLAFWDKEGQLSFVVLGNNAVQLEQVRIAQFNDNWGAPLDITLYSRPIDCGVLIQLEPSFSLSKFSGIRKFAFSFRAKNSDTATELLFDCNESWQAFFAQGMREISKNSSPSSATELSKSYPSGSLSQRLSGLKGISQAPRTPLPEGINAFLLKNCTSPMSSSESGSSSGDFRLGIRSVSSRSIPVYDCEDEGRVVVTVYVDRYGKAISAETDASTSTTTSICLLARAQEAALKTTWTADLNAPQTQIGTIIYRFEKN